MMTFFWCGVVLDNCFHPFSPPTKKLTCYYTLQSSASHCAQFPTFIRSRVNRVDPEPYGGGAAGGKSHLSNSTHQYNLSNLPKLGNMPPWPGPIIHIFTKQPEIGLYLQWAGVKTGGRSPPTQKLYSPNFVRRLKIWGSKMKNGLKWKFFTKEPEIGLFGLH